MKFLTSLLKFLALVLPVFFKYWKHHSKDTPDGRAREDIDKMEKALADGDLVTVNVLLNELRKANYEDSTTGGG